MPKPTKHNPQPRPVKHLIAASKLYPNPWKQAKSFLQGKGSDHTDWPSWCFLPIAGWLAIASEGKDPDLQTAGGAARLAALGTGSGQDLGTGQGVLMSNGFRRSR